MVAWFIRNGRDGLVAIRCGRAHGACADPCWPDRMAADREVVVDSTWWIAIPVLFACLLAGGAGHMIGYEKGKPSDDQTVLDGKYWECTQFGIRRGHGGRTFTTCRQYTSK